MQSESVFDAAVYPSLFESAKAELRARGFTLDRVDARAGLLTTSPMLSAGALSPWVGGAGSEAAIDDALHRNQRVVRVTFVREQAEGMLLDTPAAWPGSGGRPDLRLWPGRIRVLVEADVFRNYTPGRRVLADSVRLGHDVRARGERSGSAGDSRSFQPSHRPRLVRVSSDTNLADHIHDGIERRVRSASVDDAE